jgi:hypothetical protein
MIETPELGVRYYERALKSGNSIWAASRLAGLYGCDGRGALWRSYEKARPFIEKCEATSDSSMHFTLGAVYRANCDFVASWTHYNISRHLGCKDAVERLTALEELMTPRETKRALEQSQKIEAHLKPIIYSVVLQSPEKA